MLSHQICQACRHFATDSKRLKGVCRRFPVPVEKLGSESCGEFGPPNYEEGYSELVDMLAASKRHAVAFQAQVEVVAKERNAAQDRYLFLERRLAKLEAAK